MSDEFGAVAERVRERVTPDAEERERLERVLAELVERAEAAVADLPVGADVVHVGSTARGTWVSGDRDVDLFVRFPPELPREELEAYGLRVGRAVLPAGREEYAEHPYVTGELDGFEVDLVPCYRVADAAAIQSAVDRTPFHDEYLRERIDDGLAGEIRVFKQLLAGIGVYGSDLRTEGFSGYLAELLVLEYGSFRATVEAAADWHPPVELDPAGHGEAEFDGPLVVIDPTDPDRNVAAVCSAANVARLQHHARALLADPTVERFFPDPPTPLDAGAVREHVDARGTTPIAVRFDAPDLVDDQLYPQLRRSLSGVTGELDRRGFDVLRAATWAADGAAGTDDIDGADEAAGADGIEGGDGAAGVDGIDGADGAAGADGIEGGDGAGPAVLFAELAVAERPAVERHEGPPVHVREHAEDFYGTYAGTDDYGPFVDGDRYVVERARAFTTARAFLESDALFDVALGAHVEDALAEGYEVLVGEEVATLVEAFGVELARYFDPAP